MLSMAVSYFSCRPRDDPVRRAVNADGQSAATRFEAWVGEGKVVLTSDPFLYATWHEFS
jgi:hypothetical protein